MDKWIESDEPDWRASIFDEGRTPTVNHTNTNKVAEADNCDTLCTLTIAEPLNISNLTSPVLEFYRYVDRSIDDYDNGTGEYLK